MYLTVPYLLVNTIGTVCVYKDWLPESLTRPNKDVFDYQILHNFIIINCVPLIDIKLTIFGMFPTLMIGTYLQV